MFTIFGEISGSLRINFILKFILSFLSISVDFLTSTHKILNILSFKANIGTGNMFSVWILARIEESKWRGMDGVRSVGGKSGLSEGACAYTWVSSYFWDGDSH